ncbi:amino acid adenylation domain-containing protein [Microbulbifer sp. CnH-101-G]|uniref:amino acid adenylation domain-containing protein n=1 Tax=Microbulbifer sp. CnH-101-G TaxID=3243393 RepID=UPI0040392028
MEDLSLAYAHLLSSNPSIFNIIARINISKKIDEVRFSNSLLSLIKAHPILTSIFFFDSESRLKRKEVDLAIEDYLKVVQYDRNSGSLQNILESIEDMELNHKFDIFEGPLIRNTLIQGKNTSYWIINIHHSISDGWSVSQIINKVENNYRENVNLKKAITNNSGYLNLGNQFNNSKKLKYDKEFWTQTIEEIQNRKTQFPCNNLGKTNSRRINFTLSQDENKKIYDICEEHNISINDFFFSILVLLLKRQFDQSSISLSVSVLNRPKAIFKTAIGKYVKFLPIIVNVEESITFKELCLRTKQAHRRIFRSSRYPISEILRNYEISESELCPIAFNYQNSSHGDKFDNIDMDTEWLFSGLDEHQLTVNVNNFSGQGIKINFDFNSSVFEDIDKTLLIERYKNIIHAIIKNGILTTNEYLSELCNKDKSVFDKIGFYRPIETKTNGAFHLNSLSYNETNTAIQDLRENISYRKLNKLISNIAINLSNHIKKDGQPIGVYLPNGWEWIACMYAIWKSGCVYVPIDLDTPKERLFRITSNINLDIIITNDKIERVTPIKTINVNDLIKDSNSRVSKTKPFDPSSAAYLLHTSGTTGEPKCVEISHRAISEYVYNFIQNFKVEVSDKVLQQSSISFDTSLEEVLPTICSGATVVPCNRYDLLTKGSFSNFIDKNAITIISCAPSLISLLNDESEIPKSLRTIISGGDKLIDKDINNITSNSIKIYNTYGPTETTICATYKNITSNITLGKSINGYKVLIVNTNNQLMGIRTVGEIAISGLGLANGYRHKNNTTKSCFINNPITISHNDRLMYKTGDYGYIDEFGELNFLGRKDNQISRNGFRIELAEIENCAMKNNLIANCYVLWDEEQDVISCYFKGNLGEEALSNYLELNLPHYMRPNKIVKVTDIPLNGNGKIDYSELKKIEPAVKFTNVNNYKLTKVEKQTIKIWKKIINSKDKINRNSDFYSLGGNSLLAIKVSHEFQSKFRCNIPIHEIISKTKLYEHADLISKYIRTNENQGEQNSISGLPISRIQKIMLEKYDDDCENLDYIVPCTISWEGELCFDTLAKAISYLWRRHIILKSTFDLASSQHKIVDVSEMEILDFISFEESNNLESRIKSFLSEKFLYRTSPPWRVLVLNKTNNSYSIIFSFHHALVDAWSLGILYRDFLYFYKLIVSGKLPHIEEDHNFFKYIKNKKIYTESGLSQKQKNILIENYSDWPENSYSDSNIKHNKINTYLRVNNAEIARINEFCRGINISSFIFFQSLIAYCLCSWRQTKSLVMAVPIANREDIEYSNSVGCFTNTILNRFVVDSETNFTSFIDQALVQRSKMSCFNNTSIQECLKYLLSCDIDLPDQPIDLIFSFNDLYLDNTWINNSRINVSYNNLATTDSRPSVVVNRDKFGFHFQWKSGNKYAFGNDFNQFSEYFKKCINQIASIGKIKENNVYEKVKQLGWLNDTNHKLVHINSCFTETLKKCPNKLALVQKNIFVNFTDLDKLVENLSNGLLKRGIKKGDLVAISVEKSVNFIAAIFAAWRIGVGYVPLDQSVPYERKIYIIDDSKVKLLIYNKIEDHIYPIDSVEINSLIDSGKSSEIRDKICQLNDLNSPAYIIYTSGSTGNPKGVLIKHKNLANFTLGMKKQLKDLNCWPLNSWMLNHSLSFDASLKGLVCLSYGSSLVIPSINKESDPKYLIDLIKKYKIDIYNSIPDHLDLMLTHFEHEKIYINIISSGDKLHPAVLNKILKYCSKYNKKALNAYGPTETCVNVSYSILDKENGISVGTPIQNTEFYIVDNNGNILPNGAIGELYIASKSVGKYINLVSTSKNGAMLFGTGDRARFDRNGNLCIIGRTDHQIKHKGYRVELGEIEEHLNSIKDVARCAVIYEQEIYAFIELASGAALDWLTIKKIIEKNIPDYMLPKNAYFLSKLPQNSSGKICRSELSKILASLTKRDKVPNWLEEIIGVDNINLNKSFIEHGGDSIKALKIINRATKEIRKEIRFEDLLSGKSLRDILNNSSEFKIADSLIKSKFCSPEQTTIWFANQLERYKYAFNMPAIFLINGHFDIDRYMASFKKLVMTYDVLRSYFIRNGNNIIQKVQPAEKHKLNLQFFKEPKNFRDIESITRLSSKKNISLEECPLYSHEIHVTDDNEYVLYFNIHHILVDATSLRILLNKLFKCYIESKDKKVSNSFNTVKNLVRSNHPERVDYRNYLNHFTSPKNCISTLAHSSNGSEEFVISKVNCETGIEESIKKLCHEFSITEFVFFMTVYSVLLGKYGGNSDVIIVSPFEDRRYIENQEAVGMFIKTIAFRINWLSNDCLSDILERTKESFERTISSGPISVADLKNINNKKPIPELQLGLTYHQVKEDYNFILNNLNIISLPTSSVSAKSQLWLHIRPNGDGYTFEVESDGSALDKSSLNVFLSHFTKLTSLFLEKPETKFEEIDFEKPSDTKITKKISFELNF